MSLLHYYIPWLISMLSAVLSLVYFLLALILTTFLLQVVRQQSVSNRRTEVPAARLTYTRLQAQLASPDPSLRSSQFSIQAG